MDSNEIVLFTMVIITADRATNWLTATRFLVQETRDPGIRNVW